MVTLFHLLPLCGAGVGLAHLAQQGNERFGTTGAIIGGVIGALLGYFAGGIPWMLSSFFYRRCLKRSSTEELKRKVHKETHVAHLLIAELAVRGENVDDFFPDIIDMLRSEAADIRMNGIRNLQIWFPKMSDRFEQLDFREGSREFQMAVNELSQQQPDSSPFEERLTQT